jgi:hypothetical protein
MGRLRSTRELLETRVRQGRDFGPNLWDAYGVPEVAPAVQSSAAAPVPYRHMPG